MFTEKEEEITLWYVSLSPFEVFGLASRLN